MDTLYIFSRDILYWYCTVCVGLNGREHQLCLSACCVFPKKMCATYLHNWMLLIYWRNYSKIWENSNWFVLPTASLLKPPSTTRAATFELNDQWLKFTRVRSNVSSIVDFQGFFKEPSICSFVNKHYIKFVYRCTRVSTYSMIPFSFFFFFCKFFDLILVSY